MPKQSYLAELGKLLTYMTPWDRERTLEYIGKRFDEAENEAALLQELGTPVRLAVLYNRGYNPSPDPALAAQEENAAPPEWEKDEAQPDAEEEAPPAEVLTAETPEVQETPEMQEVPEATEAPTEEVRAETAEIDEVPEQELAAEEEEGSAEELPAEAEEIPEEEIRAEEEAASDEELAAEEEEISEEDEPVQPDAQEPEECKKPGFGRVLAVTILSIFPGVPLFLLLMIIDVLLLVPGAAGIGAGLILVEAGTFSLTYMADALLVFGAALIVFALALLLLYGGLWCAVKLTKVYFKGICALMRGILGKGGQGK